MVSMNIAEKRLQVHFHRHCLDSFSALCYPTPRMAGIWRILVSVRTAAVVGAGIVCLLLASLVVGFSALVAFPPTGLLLALLFVLLFVSLLCCTLNSLLRGRTSAAAFLCHVGVLTILVACAMTALLRVEGSVWIREDESADAFFPSTSHWFAVSSLRGLIGGKATASGAEVCGAVPLGFGIRLVDFSMELYPPPIRYGVSGDKEPGEFLPRKGETYRLGGGYQVTVEDYFADYDIVEQLQGGERQRVEVSRSEEPRNPVVRLRVLAPSGDAKSVRLAARAGMHFKTPDGGLTLVYSLSAEAQTVKCFKSRVEIVENGTPVKEGTIEVNRPLVYRGFAFYQSSYDPADPGRTELAVVRDPGVKVAYVGFALLAVGLTWFALAGRRQ